MGLLPKGLPFPPSRALSQPDTGTASLSSRSQSLSKSPRSFPGASDARGRPALGLLSLGHLSLPAGLWPQGGKNLH